MKSKALFSDDGEHRLLLHREWDKNGKCAMIMTEYTFKEIMPSAKVHFITL